MDLQQQRFSKYRNVVWGSHFALDQQSLEKSTEEPLSYSHLLTSTLHLQTSISTVPIIIHCYLAFFTFRDTFPTTIDHQYRVFKCPIHYSARPKHFSCRIPNTWNNLPSDITEATPVNSFKSLFNNH